MVRGNVPIYPPSHRRSERTTTVQTLDGLRARDCFSRCPGRSCSISTRCPRPLRGRCWCARMRTVGRLVWNRSWPGCESVSGSRRAAHCNTICCWKSRHYYHTASQPVCRHVSLVYYTIVSRLILFAVSPACPLPLILNICFKSGCTVATA
jgi:hypothetical protein